MGISPLARREQTGDLLKEDYISSFDYSEVKSEEDVADLIIFEEKILQQKRSWGNSTLEIGKILYEARFKLAKYNTGTFMKWYKNLGFDKDTSSFFLKRYDLFLENKEVKKYIEEIPNNLVLVLTNKNIPDGAKKEAIDRKIKNVKDFNDFIKTNYSRISNNQTEQMSMNNKSSEKNILSEKLNNLINDIEIYINQHKGLKADDLSMAGVEVKVAIKKFIKEIEKLK